MSDSEIIWNYLEMAFLNDHPAIYLYCCGNLRSSQTSIERLYKSANQVFHPMMSESLVKLIVTKFLENKKKLYIKDLITIKPIYNR